MGAAVQVIFDNLPSRSNTSGRQAARAGGDHDHARRRCRAADGAETGRARASAGLASALQGHAGRDRRQAQRRRQYWSADPAQGGLADLGGAMLVGSRPTSASWSPRDREMGQVVKFSALAGLGRGLQSFFAR